MVASTVPAHSEDAVPRFVLDQAISFAEADPRVRVRILAPHTPSSRAREWPRAHTPDGRVTQVRFGYAPRRVETLTARGIMPAIRANKAMVCVVPLLIWGERRALERAVKAQRPDVIYAHWFTPQAIVAAYVARRHGVPFGFTTHAADVAVLRRLGRMGTDLVRSVTKRAAFMTAVSQQTAHRLLGFFVPPERERIESALAIHPMGIHMADAPPPGDPHTVAVVARLVEKKGVHVLLDAWPEVKRAMPDARLIIAGDGPWRARLEQQAQPLEGVEFRGFVTGESKARVEREAAIAAVPSVVAADGDADGLPVSALEALARGRFVVASDVSGAQEILSSTEAGTVVPAGSSPALASALIAAMQRDSATRERDTNAARKLAARFEWRTLAGPMLDLLRNSRTDNKQGDHA